MQRGREGDDAADKRGARAASRFCSQRHAAPVALPSIDRRDCRDADAPAPDAREGKRSLPEEYTNTTDTTRSAVICVCARERLRTRGQETGRERERASKIVTGTSSAHSLSLSRLSSRLLLPFLPSVLAVGPLSCLSCSLSQVSGGSGARDGESGSSRLAGRSRTVASAVEACKAAAAAAKRSNVHAYA